MGNAGWLWRERADAARKQADQCTDAAAKRHALETAASYDRMAHYLEEQATQKKKRTT